MPRRHVVLVVEADVPDEAVAMSGSRALAAGASGAMAELAAASTLSFEVDREGRLSRLHLLSVDAALLGEAAALRKLDEVLRRAHEGGATLEAFAPGEALEALARRARRHWLFGAFDLPRWRGAGAPCLSDLSFGWLPGTTLEEACLGSGIRGAGGHAPDRSCDLQDSDMPLAPVPRAVGRCERAALATALLACHSRAAQAGSPLPLLRGFDCVMSFVRRRRPRLEHCASFRCDGMMDPDLLSLVGVPRMGRAG